MIQIPDEHKKVIAKALKRYRFRMEEAETLGWYKHPSIAQNEMNQIDAALAALKQPAQGKCHCRCNACKYCEQLLEPETP